MTILLLAAALTAAAPTAQAETVTSWSWSAPADASGPGAFRAVVDVGSGNDCDFTAEGTGAASSGPAGRIVIGGSWGMISTGEVVQAHANGAGIDTRSGSSGNWGLRMGTSGGTGEIEMTIMVAEMNGWLANGDDPWMPARFDVSCTGPIEVVSLAGSLEAAAFDQNTLEGTGASANGLVFTAAANVEDRMTATFASTNVEATIIDWTFTPGAAVKAWTLESETVSTSGTGGTGSGETVIEGGAGTYTFTLTQAAAATYTNISGWILGFEPVDSLDDVFA